MKNTAGLASAAAPRAPVAPGAAMALPALLALLAGCAAPPRPVAPTEATPPAATAPAAPETATVLLPVRLALPPDPEGPAPLATLTLATAQGPQVAFTQVPAPAPTSPAAPAAEAASADAPAAGPDYLFRLPLPPGRYRMTALQLREGSRQRSLALDLPFEVDSPAPRYLGRLIVRPGAEGTLALDTAWRPHEDIARYHALPGAGLRAQGVQLQPVVARGAAVPATIPTITAPPPRTDPLDTALAHASAALRQAFQRYRSLKPPKAFAVSDDGRWSSAQGAGDAPVKSLMDCAHQGGRCRLLAIDDRLVVQGAR